MLRTAFGPCLTSYPIHSTSAVHRHQRQLTAVLLLLSVAGDRTSRTPANTLGPERVPQGMSQAAAIKSLGDRRADRHARRTDLVDASLTRTSLTAVTFPVRHVRVLAEPFGYQKSERWSHRTWSRRLAAFGETSYKGKCPLVARTQTVRAELFAVCPEPQDPFLDGGRWQGARSDAHVAALPETHSSRHSLDPYKIKARGWMGSRQFAGGFPL